MKVLKSKTLHPKKQILKISDLTYNTYYEKYNPKLTDGVDDIIDMMNNPIEVFKHTLSESKRYGVGGKLYIKKLYSVEKGNQRVTQAKRLRFTHIEAIVIND